MKYLRYADLEDRRIVNSRANLSNWIKKYGFPPGQLIGPNSRVWTEVEVEAWLSARPTALKPVPKGDWVRGRKAKLIRRFRAL
jgi:predicted DNA-binding transcriptional regulator AlpA